MKTIFDLLRVRQWTKNLLIFAALLFTNNLFNSHYLLRVTAGFIILCAAASGLYIINDILDRKEDSLHPDKKNRPIASGKVKVGVALSVSIILLLASVLSAFQLGSNFLIILAVYIFLTLLYDFKLKHVVILDVFEVSAGFVLRAVMGAVVIGVSISPWLLICTTLFSLFLTLAKRRYELYAIENAHMHRKVLADYSIPLLDEMISVVTSSTVVAYSLYTFTSETAEKHHYLMFTIPFVLYGIFRYLYLIHKRNLGGSPEVILLKDKSILITVVLWVATSVFIVYFLK